MRALVVTSLLALALALIVLACSSSSGSSSGGATVDTGWRCAESNNTCNCEFDPAKADPAKTELGCNAGGYVCCFRYVPASPAADAGAEEECTCSSDQAVADSVSCARFMNQYATGSGGKYVGFDKRASCPPPK
jgi:hypothetical protein